MKVLVADDDPVSRRVIEATLQRWEYDVISCSDGLEAWRTLESEDGPKLAILDWMMPGMDGVEVCQKVRESPSTASIYIILLTARQAKDDMVAGLKAGADDYITKPFYRNELRARVQVGLRIIELQKSLAERAAENARLETLSQASRALAHHVRNALTPMLGMAEFLDPANPETATRLKEIVLSKGHYIAAIIDALIQMAHSGHIPTVHYCGSDSTEMLDMETLIHQYAEERRNRYQK